jgi:hypothetical protein
MFCKKQKEDNKSSRHKNKTLKTTMSIVLQTNKKTTQLGYQQQQQHLLLTHPFFLSFNHVNVLQANKKPIWSIKPCTIIIALHCFFLSLMCL